MSSYGEYIERLARKVEARLQDIEAIYNFDLGDEFEVAICALLEDILPSKFGVCRGFVVAENGETAGDDLIIYDKMSSPTLRSSMRRQFPVKEQIPVDAVYAYIECKHSITDTAVLEKAIGQAEAVKKLMLTRRPLSNPDYEADGPTYNGKVRGWPRTYPPLKNQPFCAIFARKYSLGVSVHNAQGEHTPDLLILGNDHIATHTVNMGADGIKSALFYDTKFGSPLCVESAPGNAYGLGLVILLQALSWVRLLPIDWIRALNATFLDNLLNRKTSPHR
ncbi:MULTISPECIES: DUF6602 domain-containing protein [unclassified Pseudomonas]|uniref:DUF6602 domain-containing protein n=1 Tax=unclassified Pseudomonas TaxID=196821 RepID=UPI000730E04F|nr:MULTISPECIES: DUF6602 domain-containing protein [unclassified Pseudomonas]KSW24183.1 hypothetical protein AOX63_10560 [Pseudomonas sp. ADP]OBP07790.1 hypothetical protein BAE52_26935 [Pseudomonas sp. EGD-AKN5]QOF86707.1 hypothetical protein IG194_08520 [Pseudomonas sp. ADPe]